MGVAAALSLIRGFIVAAILTPPAYAIYSSIVGLGGFIANGLSFGLIENTVKRFPRYVLGGQYTAMINEAKRASRWLFIRAVALVSLAGIGHLIFGHDIWQSLGIATLLAIGASLASLLASMQRSLFNIHALAKSTFAKAAVSALVIGFFAWLAGLNGALIGESLAAIVGIGLSLWFVRATIFKHRLNAQANNHISNEASKLNTYKNTGVSIFISYTLLSVPLYLDKIFINHIYGESLGANYAFMCLLLTVAVVAINIIAQKVGPNIIAMREIGCSTKNMLRYGMKWSLVGIIGWAIFIIIYLLSRHLDFLPERLAKYHLNNEMITGLFLLGALQFSSILEFILLALDRERRFLTWTIIFCIATMATAFFIATARPILATIPALLFTSRLLYILGLFFEILRVDK
jgi:O-antigen/teichoic acid export membrane protein